MVGSLGNPGRLQALRELIALSRADLMYADQYMYRAEALLQGLCTRQQYELRKDQRRRLSEASADLERAIQEDGWEQVRSLAAEALRLQDEVVSHAEILSMAEVIYGRRILEPDAHSLALTGVVRGPLESLRETCSSLTRGLKILAQLDPDWAHFYVARAAHFERVQIEAGQDLGPQVEPTHLKTRIQDALQQGQFQEVRRLAGALANSSQTGTRIRITSPAGDRAHQLAQQLPEAVLERAGRLGLVLEKLPADDVLNTYLGCRCADWSMVPSEPLSETHRKAEGEHRSHDQPPELAPALRDNLDLLLFHPFITSVGTHYIPWFGEEALLVETFAEDKEDSQQLVHALGLPRRVGLSRIQIEDALASHGPSICAELGIDPVDFAIVCIPFDAYLRLAPRYSWGRQQRWTHFDGFQLLQDAHLRALVGGDVRYGGPHDLCSVERSYDTDRLLARFAIVRRHRFLVRESEDRL